MYGILLLLHILAATIWTGGHIVLTQLFDLPGRFPAQKYPRYSMPAQLHQLSRRNGLLFQTSDCYLFFECGKGAAPAHNKYIVEPQPTNRN